ncbi:hypothetical protein EfmE1679_0951 [Enterococcus faecium E1679]|nr:hypothetical protein EfmE1679_0951 [Enterococcus faecium E1679]
MKELFSAYKLPIIFGGLGLLLAVLWLTIGFFQDIVDHNHDSNWRRNRFLFETVRNS